MGKNDNPVKGKKPDVNKIVDEKTFGMKNKGGKKGQAIAKQAASSATSAKAEASKAARAAEDRKKEKLAAEAAQRELELLLSKPAQVQKVPFGVDPKTVACIFFKKGNCEKGKKCKFSHDPDIDRKTAKKDLYQDSRLEEEDKKVAETSADWDEEKLRSVVLSKKGNQRTSTDKVCKHFIQAIEDGKYGWFWVCPNGGDKCMYRHALPPGFVVKTKEQRAVEKALQDKASANALTLEEFLESERHRLTGILTPVTPETFAKWKQERMEKKAAEEQIRKAKDATGRALFESGNWRTLGEDDEASSEDDDDDDDDDDGVWNLEKMRKETEILRAKKEEERLAAQYGGSVNPSAYGVNIESGPTLEANPPAEPAAEEEPGEAPEVPPDGDGRAEAGPSGS